ncbi:guanitoxin biosynthesis L-enduracididine beta-hydroxylase GntD [Streptomyces sp. NPDC056402]|uniref:guanitoxin biosynthesis L-enduracididine beta-hydroxylase GntD n=1 Tax=Streptomyces sp. NPDC056402 TaxID=3345810 RepID=UPI0035D7C75F
MTTSTVSSKAELPLHDESRVPCLEVTDGERAQLKELADGLLDSSPSVPLDQRLVDIAVLAHDVPERVRHHFLNFRITGRPYGGLVVSNLPIDETAAGPTPTDYTDQPKGREALRAEALLLLLGSLLGDPVSYLTQQRGRMVLDLFPIQGHESQQLGSSSTANLEWHNEDAFHPLRADWIMLIGLRNHDRVPTTFASVQDIELDPWARDILFQERFIILPDESHTAEFNHKTTGTDDSEWVRDAFSKIAEMNAGQRPVSVFSGDPEAPFIRIDPAFMPHALDADASKALDTVTSAIDASLRDVALLPGEMLIVDNKRAVHGRKPFRARYDGTDRWLRRINVIADIRRAEGRRYSPHGRALV